MKYLITADVHAHSYPKLSQPDVEFGTTGLRRVIEVLQQMSEYSSNVDRFVVIGDLFHTRGAINTFVYSAVFDVLYEISKKTQLILLAGNHDQATKGFIPTSLRAFKAFSTVIEEPTEYEGILYLPFSEDLELLRSIIAKSSAEYCFAHLGINGATIMGYEYSSENNLSADDFNKFKFTFLGHYHMSQLVGNKMMYVGSPLQHSFNDVGVTKSFVEFDTSSGKINPINTNATMFFTYEMHKLSDFNKFKSEYKAGNFYWIKNFTKSTLDTTGFENVRITQELKTATLEPRIKNIETMSDADLIKEYLNNFDDIVKKPNYKEYLNTGISLLKGAEYDK